MKPAQFIRKLDKLLNTKQWQQYIAFVQRGHPNASRFVPTEMTDKWYLNNQAEAAFNGVNIDVSPQSLAEQFLREVPEFTVMDTTTCKLLNHQETLNFLTA